MFGEDRLASITDVERQRAARTQESDPQVGCDEFGVFGRPNTLAVVPKLEKSPGLLYQLRVPLDDWSPLFHKALIRRISRAMKPLDFDAGYLWVDNFMAAGVMVYLTDTPMPDFEIVNLDEVKDCLSTALQGISPPGPNQVGRFRPYGGSKNWVSNAAKSGEENAGRWEIIADTMDGTKWLEVQAGLITRGIETELVAPFWPRSQWGTGLIAYVPNRSIAKEVFQNLGYKLARGVADRV